ncbi:MAG: roadblock/LC7 domain-containing protein [Candidatus Lokiarchaeota archaeon]|nr:roadblock/LC7 domain-containing protein [Candidatus Lokiarchaeota archaeon]
MDSIQIEQVSKELIKLESVLGIIGTVLVDRNGLTITSRVPRTIDEKKIGALAATMFEAMETAIEELNEEIINITVEYDEYQLVVMGATIQVILVALIEYNIDIGITLIEVEESLSIIQEIIRDDKNVDK